MEKKVKNKALSIDAHVELDGPNKRSLMNVRAFINYMDRVFHGPGFTYIQWYLRICKLMKREGITHDEIEQYHDFIRDKLNHQVFVEQEETKKLLKVWEEKAPKCPECGKPLWLRKIFIPKGRNNMNGYNACFYHRDPFSPCAYEEYTVENYDDVLSKFGLPKLVGM